MPVSSVAIAQTTNVATTVTGDVKQLRSPKAKLKDERDAEDAFIMGARLLERNDRVHAEKQFAIAAQLCPDNRDYALALHSVRDSEITELIHSAGKARLLGHNAEAESLLAQARKIDPGNAILLQHPDPKSSKESTAVEHSWILDGPRLAGPIAIKPKSGVQSFHIHAAIGDAVRQVAAAYGIKASIDSSISTRQVRFDLEDVPYAQAMHILMAMGPLFATPLTSDSILVAKDNEENRQKFDHLLQETIYVAGMTHEQIAELGNMIRNVFEVKQIVFENNYNTIVLRCPEETLRVLNLTLDDLLDGGSQVMFDLKLYSIDHSRTNNIGATLPSQAGAYNAATQATQLVQANQSVVDQAIAQGIIPAGTSDLEIAALLIKYGLASSSLLTSTLAFIGGGITTTGLYSSATPTLNLAINASDTRALDEIQLRVGDRQSATFRAGSKYPITQSTYSTTAAPASTSALAGATINGVSVASLLNSATTSTIPQVQYEDLGVTLKATPTVQKSGLISLHLDLKIESLAGGTVDNIPVLNNNSFTSDITVPDGGTAFLVSNLTKNQSSAVVGIPGLSELPGFQSSPELVRTTDVGQLLMIITPHLVRRRPDTATGPLIPIALPAVAASE